MIKIAHFLRDDNKFIPDSIWCFENCGLVNNSFFCVGKRLHRLHDPRVTLINEEEARKLVEKSCEYDIICLHSLYSLPLSIIPLINKRTKVVWYSWGYDIYMNSEPFSPLIDDINIYLPETDKVLKTLPNDDIRIRTRVKLFVSKLVGKKIPSTLLYDCVERIDYFAGVFPIEYNFLYNKYSFFRAERISHNYIHPDEFLMEDIRKMTEITGCNIQLGHSACPEDNHIDIMKMLVDRIDGNTEIICPLSYGGPKNYINGVIDKGQYYFGNRFKAITDFLPFEEYTRLQKSCNRFVLGAIRQQATCNCLTAIWNGIQLYLHSSSMNFIQYQQFGLKVFDVERDFPQTISFEQHIRNREIIESIYSYRAWKRDMEEFLESYNLSFNGC